MRRISCIHCLSFLVLIAAGITLQGARKETWVEVKSPHFVAYSDAGEAEARKALMGFEGIRSVFDSAFHGIRVDPPRPMIVIVVEDEAVMKRILPESFQGKDPARPAGVFISRSDRNYAILRLDIDYQVDQPYFVLFHEYTHSVIHQNFPSLPSWLDEGMADFYGATEIRSEHVYIGRVPLVRLDLLRNSIRLPLETVLSVTQDSPHYREGEKAGIFYAQSWAFVHYLFMNEEARKVGLLQAYLKALGDGGEALAVARKGFGDIGELQEKLTTYWNQPRFQFWNLPLTVKLVDKDFQARPLDEAGGLVVRAEFLQYTQHEMDSRPLLDRAISLAPQRAEVQVAAGYGHFLRSEEEAAHGAFLSALALGSRDFRPPYYLATMAQGHAGGGFPDSKQTLAWLETAKSLRPDFSPIRMALCRQYSWDPRNPEKALEEGRAAVALDPTNLANLANLGNACMSLDLEKEAKEVGTALRRAAATASEKGMAVSYQQELSAFLERKKAAAAEMPDLASLPVARMPAPPAQNASIKFSLPSYLAPLGQEVLRLAGEGHLAEAIEKVEKAIGKARYDYDRKALRALLKSLRERSAPQQVSQQPSDSRKATPTRRDGAK